MKEQETFIFHYTGKGQQSYIMKQEDGTPVYEAICDKFSLFKESDYTFVNHVTGTKVKHKIAKTKSIDLKILGYGGTIKSSFKIDGEEVWKIYEKNGYNFHFHLHGLKACYDVKVDREIVGTIEMGGTGLMDPKYKDSKLGQVPTNGIFKISCAREDIENVFLLCLAVTRTEFSLQQMK